MVVVVLLGVLGGRRVAGAVPALGLCLALYLALCPDQASELLS